MTHPQACNPEYGYKFQILAKNTRFSRIWDHWDHCDYATDKGNKNYLLTKYRQAYGAGWEFKVIVLPRKYWPENQTKKAV